ncbi:membrane protein [Arthrobacter phage Qui]|uniref:Membrane protein n=1 Tax=Arthrobacter phage Qui TaxID=2603260 RepID=A0A5B8WLU3_9CAUD|nr:membrane protein [Arthrobacter phage Qui]QED11572.1 membrane protein [Arthrobacter phage Qui]QOC56404.1 membrane protein [Arthrobacter phage Paella]
MRKFIMSIVTLALISLSFVLVTPAANAGSNTIGICHATGNGKYIYTEAAKNGTVAGHAGLSHQNGGDIIPAFTWIEDKIRYYFDGQNLDKASLLQNGCKAPADNVIASPIVPVYVPASCTRPELPYGEVVIPEDKGAGVASATTPALNTNNTVWTTSYTLVEPTEDEVYSWPANFNSTFKFNVVPLTEDPLWVVDSKTGEGNCVLPEMGAKDYALPIGGALVLMTLGAIALRANRKKLV